MSVTSRAHSAKMGRAVEQIFSQNREAVYKLKIVITDSLSDAPGLGTHQLVGARTQGETGGVVGVSAGSVS